MTPPYVALLSVLHREGFHDLRAFKAGTGGNATTVGVAHNDSAGVAAFVERYRGLDLYFGVAERETADVRSLEGCTRLWALFVDQDFKGHADEEAARRALAAFPFPPSAQIASGGGLQCYWFLRKPIDIDGQATFAKNLLRSLAHVVGGDRAAAEPARILRLPGTTNHKYDPVRHVELEYCSPDAIYDLKDLAAHLPILPDAEKNEDTAPVRHGLTREVRMRLARNWLDKQPGAVQGNQGDTTTYSVCAAVIHGHDLPLADAFDLVSKWNARCTPPWPEADLRAKLRSAARSARGPRGERLRLVLSPGSPVRSAQEFATRHYFENDMLALRHQAGVFYAYDATAGCYRERDEQSIRAELYRFLESAVVYKRAKGEDDEEDTTPAEEPAEGEKARPKYGPFHPNRSKVENVLDALRGYTNLRASTRPPCWLSRETELDAMDMLAFPNGLLHVPTRTFHPPTPHLYTMNAVEFNYDPMPATPELWYEFLRSLWGDDMQSIIALQEMFGYLLLPDTKNQKMFMLIGVMRSGKGTIGRILRKLVGETNTCNPTLTSFASPFGKQALIGKTLAIINDAKVSGQNDTGMIAETLLSISGEDSQTIPRKFLPDWNGRLPTRFLMLTNSLPKLADESGALVSRFIVFRLVQSFLGREDKTLEVKLTRELPGILLWALDGRDRLVSRGYLEQPQSGDDMIQAFNELGAPEAAFLREHTVRTPGAYIPQRDLFLAWCAWCKENGRDYTGSAQTFGRNVRAACPWVTVRKVGPAGGQARAWEGIGLLDTMHTDSDKGDM